MSDAFPIDRDVYLRFQIDTNRINARGGEVFMNRLEAWAANEVIEILMSEPSFHEATVPPDRQRRRKAMGYVQSETLAETPDERDMLRRIATIIFPGGARTDSQRRDVEIVFNAWKYGAMLLTNDGASKSQPGGILGARAALRVLDIHVMTDATACALVEQRVADRDARARRLSIERGLPLPGWVGRD